MDKKPTRLKKPLPKPGEEIDGIIFIESMIHEKEMFILASFRNKTSLCIIKDESRAFYYPNSSLDYNFD